MEFNFECKKCGGCCHKLQIQVKHEDITRWKKESRFDIIESINDRGIIKGTGEGKCPWLINNLCFIHATKPLWCRRFPSSMLKAKMHCSQYK